jgi:cytochrome c oxidase subunit 2
MKHRTSLPARLLALVALAASLVFLAGCGAFGGDQNTFNPSGDVADKQLDLFLLVLWPAIAIMFLVMGALVYIMVRFRHKEGAPLPKQIHGNTRLELAWTIAPAVLLVGIAVPTVIGIVDVGREPKADALHVTVTAFRFGWQFEYTDPEFADAEGKPLRSDELRIPVDREVGVLLESQDVIHSFWVPKLAGKLDVMPGRGNNMWFNATEPGVYSGQCAELCGTGHAGMRFDVVAQTQGEFDDWVQEQLTPAAAAGSGN